MCPCTKPDSDSLSAHPAPLHILGTGVLAEEFFALAAHMGVEVCAFVENIDRTKSGTTLCGRPILWVDDVPDGAQCLCALSTTTRERYIDQLRNRVVFTRLIHPSALILPGTSMGEGTVVSMGALIASNTTIGEHVFINRGASIGHHTRIGNFVTIQPRANIAGLVNIGASAYVGMSAVVTERRTVGSGSTIAAGAVVVDDVPEHVLVAGVPAVVKKRGIDAR